ncbi:MAG: aminotransferase class III-fold pyridoxal phosphate-dependent enzyme [Steroidobacteraceae bacterium]
MTTTALSAALSSAKQRYAARNPSSYAHWQSAARAMPGGNTRSILFFDPFPLCMVRGEGCQLFDADGHRYVDLLGEYTAGIFGHSHPIIGAAVIDALRNGINLSAHNDAEIRLANLIRERYASIELVRFTNSGTEANLMAIATSIAFTGRRRIMVFGGAYHGSVLKFGGTPSPINVPHDFLVAPYNDIEATRTLIRSNAGALAGVLVEPMLGSGGCIPGAPEFLGMLAEETRASGAMLIFDEIQTSRLSAGGRQALLGIRPDLTTLGKYHGGGLSFGAFGGRADVMSMYDPRDPKHLSHAGTFNNNVLSMAAGYAGLSAVATAQALDGLNRRGDSLRAALNELFVAARTGLCASGLGSLLNIHAGGVPSSNAPANALVFFDLLERGFYCAPRGLIALSLAVDDTHIAAFLAAVRDLLETRAGLL